MSQAYNGDTPQTGDDNNVLLYLFVALGGIGCIVYRRKVQNR